MLACHWRTWPLRYAEGYHKPPAGVGPTYIPGYAAPEPGYAMPARGFASLSGLWGPESCGGRSRGLGRPSNRRDGALCRAGQSTAPQPTSRETWCGLQRGLGSTCQVSCIVIEGARSQQIVKTCQNPFSAVVSVIITEGVYGHRRRGLDHTQPKHLSWGGCMLHRLHGGGGAAESSERRRPCFGRRLHRRAQAIKKSTPLAY